MAPKSRQSVTPSPAKPSSQAAKPSPPSAASTRSSSKSSSASSLPDIAQQLWADYLDKTPQRTKLLDCFLAYLAVLGAIQFAYCVLAGNYVCRPCPSPTLLASTICQG